MVLKKYLYEMIEVLIKKHLNKLMIKDEKNYSFS